MAERRENGAGSVYFDHKQGPASCRDKRYHRNCTGRWSGSLSLGNGKRTRVTGKTKSETLAKLDQARRDNEIGMKVNLGYTVSQCLDDFLETGMEGLAPRTIELAKYMAKLLKAQIGNVKLRDLSGADVQRALKTLSEGRTSRSVVLAKNVLERAIRLAQQQDMVSRNVAKVVKAPAGKKASKPRQAFTLDEMLAVLKASVGYRNMDAYIHLSFLLGASPDEIRGLHWAQVDDLDGSEPGVDITRTLRHGGSTKTTARIRGLGLPEAAVASLKRHKAFHAAERLAAGEAWHDQDLVFSTRTGGPLGQGNVRRSFRAVCKKAGITDWDQRVPYECRHTFASLQSDHDVPAEEIALQLGHTRTTTLESVYRHVMKPRRRAGQQVMDSLIQTG